MTDIITAAATAAVLDACAQDPDIRILRRGGTLEEFPVSRRRTGPTRLVALIDTETTGTDVLTDEIIDIAVVTIEVDAKGEIVAIVSKGEALRDPGRELPEAITKLTGLTDEDVRGQSIDLDRLEAVIARADVRIAHNCAFDAAFIEDLLPGLAGAAWACSANDVDWLSEGFDGRKLGHLLMQIGRFNSGHRAMADVISLLHLLAHRLGDGQTVLGRLLAHAEQTTVRLEASGAAYGMRSLLKSRGYRWDPRVKAWWIELPKHEETSETLWLIREILPDGASPRSRPISWHERHR